MQVAHQVFEGLAGYVMNDKGEMVAEPVLAESWDTTDSQTWTFHLKKGVMFQAPVSREVKAQDFVDSWNYVTDPANQSYVSYILAPVEGCDDGGYQVDPKAGLTGVKAIDDYTLEVKLRYPFAEFPQTLGHTVAVRLPARLPQGDRRQGLQPEARSAPARTWSRAGRTTRASPWSRTRTTGTRRPVVRTSTTSTCRSSPCRQTVWLEFQKGSIDYTVVPPGQVAAVREQPQGRVSGEWTAKRWPALAIYFVGMNMTDKTLGTEPGPAQCASPMSADAQNVINIVNEGVSTAGRRLRARGHPRLPGRPDPVPVQPGRRRQASVIGHGHRPDARLLVQHRRRSPEDRRSAAGGLAEGRPRRQAQQLRVGHLPRQALQGQQGQRQPDLPHGLDRRLPVHGQLPVPAVPVGPGAYRQLHLLLQPRRSTTCSSRPAPRPTRSSATTCTRRPRRSSSPTCRPSRCTSTGTTA